MSTSTSPGTCQEGAQGGDAQSICASPSIKSHPAPLAHVAFLSLELVKGEWVKFIPKLTHTNDLMDYISTQTDAHLCLKV